MNGQMIPYTVESRATVGQLKERLSQNLNGYPVSMIRVRGQMNLPLKDGLTLAFFNIPDSAILEMSVKSKK